MRTILNGTMIVLVMIVVGLAIILPSAKAGYDYDKPLGPNPINALMQIPPETVDKYGRTENVRLCYNIAELLKAVNKQEVRIKYLEGEVALLSKKALQEIRSTVDPNEVVE